MVDVTPKDPSHRRAIARGKVFMKTETTGLVARGAVTKGDVLAVARVAGIMAAKRAPDLIPLCHPLLLTHVAVELLPDEAAAAVRIEATVRTNGKTGVVMEVLTAVMWYAMMV